MKIFQDIPFPTPLKLERFEVHKLNQCPCRHIILLAPTPDTLRYTLKFVHTYLFVFCWYLVVLKSLWSKCRLILSDLHACRNYYRDIIVSITQYLVSTEVWWHLKQNGSLQETALKACSNFVHCHHSNKYTWSPRAYNLEAAGKKLLTFTHPTASPSLMVFIARVIFYGMGSPHLIWATPEEQKEEATPLLWASDRITSCKEWTWRRSTSESFSEMCACTSTLAWSSTKLRELTLIPGFTIFSNLWTLYSSRCRKAKKCSLKVAPG